MSKYIVTAATKLSITGIDLAQPILDKIKTIFTRNTEDAIWESDTKARRVLCRYDHLLSESEKIALAEAYLDMAKYAWRKNDNKEFFSIAKEFEESHGVTLTDTRATINAWISPIRRRVQEEIRANRAKTEVVAEVTETPEVPEEASAVDNVEAKEETPEASIEAPKAKKERKKKK